MLSSLEIKNFKGIRDRKISGLAQVNVLVGRNNSGKSTVLDALLLMRCTFANVDYLDNFTPEQLVLRKIDSRGQQGQHADYAEMHHRLEVEQPILLVASFSDGCRTNQEWNMPGLSVKETKVDSQGAGRSDGDRSMSRRSVDRLSAGPNWPSLAGTIGHHNATVIAFTHLIDTTTLQTPFLEKIWGRLFADRRDRTLRDMINDVYSMNTEVFNQADFGGYNRVTAGLPERGVAVDWLGDGLRYALNILALGMLLEGTILMVEEMETPQHPESLKRLPQTLFELAKKQNLQLFLTTHNWDLMTYALEAAEKTGLELAFHHVRLNERGEFDSRAIPSPDAKLLLDIGHDIRPTDKYIKAR